MKLRAKVAIARASAYDRESIAPAICQAVEVFGGWDTLVRCGDRVLVKPNCISGVPPDQPAQTHPAVILETCRQLLDFGARPFVGDSPAWGSLHGNLGRLGILDDLQRLGVPVVPFKNPVLAENPRGKVFHRLTVDRTALDADAIVNLPKFKAHRQLVLTVAIKNMFGCVGGRRKAWWHVKAGSFDNYFARMLVDTFEMLRPAITLIDAVVAMQGKGPISGTPKFMGLILAATDGPALERVAAELAGVAPHEIRTLQAARELEVGTPYLEQIDIAGPPLAEVKPADFEIPRLLPIGFSLPRFVKGSFKQVWLSRQEENTARSA